MTLAGYLLAALLYVILQSLFINGVKASATGTTERMPNNADKDGEMILYPLYKYLMQFQMVPIYYTGTEFWKLIGKIAQLYPTLRVDKKKVDYISCTVRIESGDANDIHFWTKAVTDLDKIEPGVKTIFDHQEGSVSFYKEFQLYRFSKYIRKPIIQCIVCMASVWTIPTYWFPMFYNFGFSNTLIIVYFGIINTTCVGYMNYLLFKKIG